MGNFPPFPGGDTDPQLAAGQETLHRLNTIPFAELTAEDHQNLADPGKVSLHDLSNELNWNRDNEFLNGRPRSEVIAVAATVLHIAATRLATAPEEDRANYERIITHASDLIGHPQTSP